MKLSDHFTPFICKSLKHDLGVTTIEEAQSLSDDKLMRVRGIGKMFIQKLRRIKVYPIPTPTRQFCQICGGIHKVDFWVKDHIWKAAIHKSFQNSIVCLNCFMERADEKFLEWEKDIILRPTSFYTQRQIQL